MSRLIDMQGRKSLWLRGGLMVLLVAAICGGMLLLPVQEYTRIMLEWTDGLGNWGYPVLVGVYMISTLLFLPGSILTLAAGFLYGVVAGSLAVTIGSTLGATAAFLAARYLARDKIEHKMADNVKFNAIDDAVEQQGFKIVLLVYLSPLYPFNLLNYLFGLTRVPFWTFITASWLGTIPYTVLSAYLGSTANDLSQIFEGGLEGGTWQQLFKISGLVVTLAATIYITLFARRALKQAVAVAEKKMDT